ncbi:MAG: AAA family ATPase [Gammaproteobacteria bacterium]|nr:AAA family ATPase [Gammaproteobacteria bacterium]
MPSLIPDPLVLQRARERWARQDALCVSRQAQIDALTTEIALAKGRLALRPDVEALVERLATRAHERSVGHYETLLTALVQDVLPEGEQRVVLALETKRDLPALSLSVVRKNTEGEDQEPEDILDGNGGSLTNVIVAGLRYIALTRSGQRPFIILDEPDCWLRPDRIPAFGQVISQLAHNAKGGGIQTLLISHHDAQIFDTGFQVSLVRTGPNSVCSQLPEGQPPPFPEGHPGIRRITLENCLSHAHTEIPLSPGLTVLTGDHNIGKSAVVTSLRALAYGESSDALIRHGCDFMRVTLDLPEGQVLTWERRRKGNPKTLYRLTDASGALLHDGGAGREVPDWVVKVLGMSRLDGLDVQIGNQKNPVFLLDEPDTKRASILSIGREAGLLDAIRRLWKQRMDADRKTIREGEVSLARIRAIQERVIPLLQDAKSRLQDAQESLSTIQKMDESVQRLTPLTERLEGGAHHQDRAMRLRAARAQMPAPPAPVQTAFLARTVEDLDRWAARLARLRNIPTDRPTPPTLPPVAEVSGLVHRLTTIGTRLLALQRVATVERPVAPVLPDAQAIIAMGKRLRRYQEQAARYARLATRPRPVAPTIAPTGPLEQVLKRTQDLSEQGRALQEAARTALRDRQAAEAEMQRLKDEYEVCPLCGTAFAEGHTMEDDEERQTPSLGIHRHATQFSPDPEDRDDFSVRSLS